MVKSGLLEALVGLAALTMLAACAGRPGGEAAPGLAGSAVPELHSLEQLLGAELERLGIDQRRELSKAPLGAANAVFTLSAVQDDSGAAPVVRLSWVEQLTGDYDMNGVVGINDLTALSISFGLNVYYHPAAPEGPGQQWPFGNPVHTGVAELYEGKWISGPGNWRLARVDGDANGEIGLSDIKPLAQNFGNQLDGYRIYRRSADGQAFEVLDGGGPQGILPRPGNGVEVPMSSQPPLYSFDDTAPLFPAEYCVVPVSLAVGEGAVSNLVRLESNIPPLAQLVITEPAGSAPHRTLLDPAGSHDPDAHEGSGIVEYRYDVNGDGIDDIVTTDPAPVAASLLQQGSGFVRLTVVDAHGASEAALQPVSIEGWAHTLGQQQPENKAFRAFDAITDMLLAADGSIYLSGYTTVTGSAPGAKGFVLAKFSLDGQLLWQRVLPAANHASDRSCRLLSDGVGSVYMGMLGSHHGATPDAWDAIFLKFSTSGELLWQKEYTDTTYEYVTAARLLNGNPVFYANATYQISTVTPVAFELDQASGDLLAASDLRIDPARAWFVDGSTGAEGAMYLVGGRRMQPNYTPFVLRLSHTHEIEWIREFPGLQGQYLHGISSGPDGDLWIAGGGTDGLVLRMSSAGTLLSAWSCSAAGEDSLTALSITAGGIVLTGSSNSFSGNGLADALLLRMPLSMDSVEARAWGSGWMDQGLRVASLSGGGTLLGVQAYGRGFGGFGSEPVGSNDLTPGRWLAVDMTVQPLALSAQEFIPISTHPQPRATGYLRDLEYEILPGSLLLDVQDQRGQGGEICLIRLP